MILLWLYLAGAAITLAGLGVHDAILLERSRKECSIELNSPYLILVIGWPVALVAFAIWVLVQLVYMISAFITCVIIGKIKHKRKEQNK